MTERETKLQKAWASRAHPFCSSRYHAWSLPLAAEGCGLSYIA